MNVYYFDTSWDNKKQANKRVKELRKSGFKCKLLKRSFGYMVYIHKKK